MHQRTPVCSSSNTILQLISIDWELHQLQWHMTSGGDAPGSVCTAPNSVFHESQETTRIYLRPFCRLQAAVGGRTAAAGSPPMSEGCTAGRPALRSRPCVSNSDATTRWRCCEFTFEMYPEDYCKCCKWPEGLLRLVLQHGILPAEAAPRSRQTSHTRLSQDLRHFTIVGQPMLLRLRHAEACPDRMAEFWIDRKPTLQRPDTTHYKQ